MNGCEERREELVELVFGELDEERAAELNLHLVECDRCRREERELLQLRESLAAEDPEPVEGLRARVRAALPARKKKRSPLRLLGAPVPAYAAAAAVVLTALLVRGVAPGPERRGAGPERIALGDDRAVRFAHAGSYETWVGGTTTIADSASDTGFPPADSL